MCENTGLDSLASLCRHIYLSSRFSNLLCPMQLIFARMAMFSLVLFEFLGLSYVLEVMPRKFHQLFAYANVSWDRLWGYLLRRQYTHAKSFVRVNQKMDRFRLNNHNHFDMKHQVRVINTREKSNESSQMNRSNYTVSGEASGFQAGNLQGPQSKVLSLSYWISHVN